MSNANSQAEQLNTGVNFWKMMNKNLSQPFDRQLVPIRLTEELKNMKVTAAKFTEAVKEKRTQTGHNSDQLIRNRKVLLGNQCQVNFETGWKNIPEPIHEVVQNYGGLIERLIVNLNMLESDFCNAFAANNLRFTYSEGSFHEQYETLKKRDNECYNVLKKMIEQLCKATPEALEATRVQILD